MAKDVDRSYFQQRKYIKGNYIIKILKLRDNSVSS